MRTAIRALPALIVLAGVAVLPEPAQARTARDGLATCSYQYSRWHATESSYWRALYEVCVNVADERPQD